MEVFRTADLDWEPADGRHFTGTARVRRRLPADATLALKVFRVQFEPRARTHWHAHSGAQWLVVIEGRCRVQAWGEPAAELEPGESVFIPPTQKHWHGAASSSRMTHIAINIEATTEWLEPVSDEQFGE